MKSILLSIICSLLFLTGFTQTKKFNIDPNKVPKQIVQNEEQVVRGISPMTAFLLLDMKEQKNPLSIRKLSDDSLIEKYGLIKKDGIIYSNSFITIQEGFNIEELSEYGVLPGFTKGLTNTALIPINQIGTLSKHPEVKYIQIGEKAKPTMDNARWSTKVNQVHAGTSLPQSYFGEGVVVGIIDGGFDYTHPNFYNSTGAAGYRIKRVWEQNATSGTPPNGFSYGRELRTQSAILSAQRDKANGSHGTHVAGIAAGAGGGASTTYMGVAPKADLVLVSTNMTNPGVLEGIAYIQDYAASVGKPCVINMSLGYHLGPHDGTSTFDQQCDDYFVGEGRILVGAAGNEGDESLYATKRFTSTDSLCYSFILFPAASNYSNGETYIDIWGEPNKDFYVGVYIYNVQTDQVEDFPDSLYNGNYTNSTSYTLYDNDYYNPDACYVDIETDVDPNNNKPRALIKIDNTSQDDAYRLPLIVIKSKNNQIKMWAVKEAIFSDLTYGSPFIDGSTSSTVGEIGGTGKSIISVGAYTSKNSWTSYYTQSTQQTWAYVPNGEIAPFSSKGPTADNRVKPDITAPGNVIVSSVSSFDADYDYMDNKVVEGVTNNTNVWWFGTNQGTSMAAPLVTGIIALWLEMYPYLTPDQIKELMKNNSITDAYTGNISANGSNIWGRGKVNAWVDIPSLIPQKPQISPNNSNICEGANVTLSAPAGFSKYEWSNGAKTQRISVNSSGFYKVMVTNSSGYKSPWSNNVEVKVNANPPTPVISKNGNILKSNVVNGNQWYKNGSKISGATAQTYTVNSKGNYKVIVTNSSGCSAESKDVEVTPTGIAELEVNDIVSIYPNPAKNNIHIKFTKNFKNTTIVIYNNKGDIVLSKEFNDINKDIFKTISLESIVSGNYKMRVINEEIDFTKNITIVK